MDSADGFGGWIQPDIVRILSLAWIALGFEFTGFYVAVAGGGLVHGWGNGGLCLPGGEWVFPVPLGSGDDNIVRAAAKRGDRPAVHPPSGFRDRDGGADPVFIGDRDCRNPGTLRQSGPFGSFTHRYRDGAINASLRLECDADSSGQTVGPPSAFDFEWGNCDRPTAGADFRLERGPKIFAVGRWA